uniref:Uncharacterized protein n=1 Tax=Anguilla anguilla TaxID=7936 RepID=A0A0E9SA49_ANGAN
MPSVSVPRVVPLSRAPLNLTPQSQTV